MYLSKKLVWTWKTQLAAAFGAAWLVAVASTSWPIERGAQAICGDYFERQDTSHNGAENRINPSLDCVSSQTQEEIYRANHRENHWPDFWLATGTWALVFGTLFLGYFTYWLWREARAGGAKQARAAALELKIARRQIVEARQAHERELRPYIVREQWSVAAWKVDPKTGDVVEWMVTYRWKNVGQTPARRALQWLNSSQYANDASLVAADFPDIGTPDIVGTAIGPGQFAECSIAVSTTDLLPGALTSTGISNPPMVYVWAWFEYDGFDDAGRHRTEICCRLIAQGDPRKKETPFRDEYKTAFNAMDADCHHKPKT